MQSLRRALGAALILLAACGLPPDRSMEEAVPDLIRVVKGEVTYYVHPEDEAFLSTLHPKILAYRAKVGPSIKRSRAFLKEHLPDPAAPNRFGLDTPLGARLFDALMTYLDVPAAEQPDYRDGWTTFTGFDGLYSGFFSRMLDIISCDHVRVATFGEVRGDKIPFWSYLAGEDRLNFHFSIVRNEKGEKFLDAAKRTVPGAPVFFSFVVCRDKSPEGRTWEQRLETAVESAADFEGGLAKKTEGKAEFSLFDRAGSLSAFIALHEMAELWLLQALEIRDPLARWFHDGAANFIAETILREQISEEAALSSPYSVRFAPTYADKRAGANLSAWARKDIQDLLPSRDKAPLYFFATEELRGLEERHGKGSIRKLIFPLKAIKPVRSETIFGVAKELWGDDLQARLAAYSPKLAPGVAMTRVAAVNGRRWEEAVSLLRQSAESAPRDLQARYMLVGSLLSLDPEKYLTEILFHGRVYLSLAQATGQESKVFWAEKYDAKTYWAYGKLAIEFGNPDSAKQFFQQALKEQPNHAPSLDELRKLEKADSK